jgi:Alginate lyase
MKNVYQLLDSVTMLQGSKHWTSEDDKDMERWMAQYLKYLTSEHVLPERRSINNHGTYYDLQLVSILRYLGRIDEARHYLNTNGKERLRIQVLLYVFLIFRTMLSWQEHVHIKHTVS